MDHSHEHASVDGPWAGGWVAALLAGLLTVGLMASFSDVGLFAMSVAGAVVFGVFGVLLGAGGVELTVTSSHGAGHGDHGHH